MSKRSFPVKLFFFSMKGKLLISTPGLLTDMIFYKSIILIVDQTDEGFTGFILNRRSDLFMFKEIESSKKIKIDLYYGGPVSTDHFFLLKSDLNIYIEFYSISGLLRMEFRTIRRRNRK